MEQMNPKEIQTHEIFKSLFPVDPKLLTKIEESMKTSHYHYDPSQPIVMASWPGQAKPVLIDGHTRMQASINAGIQKVYVCEHEFDSEQEALEHTIRLQSNRRNLTDGDILSCVEVLHKARPRGGDRRSQEAKSKSQSCGNENSKSASATTAELLNISSRKVEQALRVIKNATSDLKEAVLHNEISINRACEEIKKENAEEGAEEEGEEAQSPSPLTNDEPKPAAEAGAPKGRGQNQKTDTPENTKPAGRKRVTVSLDQYRALTQLGGGSVEDHLDIAVERYLESFQEQHEESSRESGEKEDDDGESLDGEDNEECADDNADNESADESQNEDEDDEEYFDPADYDDEE